MYLKSRYFLYQCVITFLFLPLQPRLSLGALRCPLRRTCCLVLRKKDQGLRLNRQVFRLILKELRDGASYCLRKGIPELGKEQLQIYTPSGCNLDPGDNGQNLSIRTQVGGGMVGFYFGHQVALSQIIQALAGQQLQLGSVPNWQPVERLQTIQKEFRFQDFQYHSGSCILADWSLVISPLRIQPGLYCCTHHQPPV